MRSIIFTSALACAGLPAAAELPMGCFARSYSAAHLAGQPDQVVKSLILWVGPSEMAPGEVWAGLSVIASDSARTRAEGLAGAFLDQSLFCWEAEGENAGCSVECDGGYMEFLRFDDSELVFSTNYLLVGDTEGCGGAMDLSEGPGQLTRYRLDRVDDSMCGGVK